MQFKKLTLAVALGTVLVGPAAMAQSSVQLYGKLYPYLLLEKGSSPTAVGTPVSTLAASPTGVVGTARQVAMTAGNSRWGLRGTEDLGGGLKAHFQLESQVHVDDGTGNSSAGALVFNRNTYVGLSGGWGEIKLGNHDTIFKEYGDTIGILGISSGTFMSTSDVLRKTGFGTSSASSFHLRRPNSVIYETPEFGGFTAGLQWSTNEAPSTDLHRGKVYSMGVKWEKGPFYVALAHEIHKDLFGGSANAPSAQRNNAATDPTRSTDKATQFTVEWRLNKQHKFEFDAIRKEYDENPLSTSVGKFQNYHNTAFLLAMENRWTDKFRTAAHYVVAREGSCSRVAAVCSTDGLDGKQITLAAAYYLSKRTYLWTAVNRITNGKSARFNNNDLDLRPNPGEDLTHFAVGVTHSF